MSETSLGLDRLLGAFVERGSWIPVAVGHAIAQDLAGHASPDGGTITLDEVEVDPAGRVIARRPLGPSALVDVVRLLIGGEDGRCAPPTAWPALSAAEAVRSGPSDQAAERVQAILRAQLPPPATEDEVGRLVRAVAEAAEPDWESLPTRVGPATEIGAATEVGPRPELEPDRAPTDEPPVLDIEALTGVPAPADSDPPAAPPLPGPSQPFLDRPSASSAEQRTMAHAGPLVEGAARGGRVRRPAPDAAGERPVVRHQLPRSDKPVTLTRAPAARRSARAGVEGNDAIFAPGEDRGWTMWLVVLAALAGAMYLLFFQ